MLKFFAAKEYSDVFQKAVKRVIEEFDGKYTGCYGCGKCTGELEGYTYVYPDGKSVYRCGNILLKVAPVSIENLEEIKQLLEIQDKYFISKQV